jgi:initiation factor 1A
MPKKNTKGGSRHKKMASKSFKEPRQIKMRYAQKGESYARVTRLFGQGMVDVICNDEVVRLCIIRKKFRGRNKRDNNCKVDSMILVGLREWEVLSTKKTPKVDLLYTYDKQQIDDLKAAKDFNKKILPESVIIEEQMDGYEYDRTSATQQEIMAENNKHFNTKISKTENKQTKETEQDFNWDDI